MHAGILTVDNISIVSVDAETFLFSRYFEKIKDFRAEYMNNLF